MPVPLLSRVARIVRRHWLERRHYPRTRDWAMSVYNRMLIHLPRLPMPGRRRTWTLTLAGAAAPLRARLGTSDWYVMEEIFLAGEYEPLVRRGLRDVRNVLDLGANVGASVRLWRTLWPGVRVIAVEPDAENLEIAKANTGGDAGPTPVFLRACVAGHARTVHLDRTLNEYSFRMNEGAHNGEAIDALTVPLICERGGLLSGAIDLLKCDIEGAEAEVFADCGAWIGRVRYMAVEVHAPYTAEKLLDDLRRAGVSPGWTEAVSKGDFGLVFLQCAAT